MSRFRSGWLVFAALSVLLAFAVSQRFAAAEKSWTEGYEIYVDGQQISLPWGAVNAFADGQILTPNSGILSAHLGDNIGGYADNTSHRLSRSVDVVYTGTTVSFFASYVMADTGDYALFEYSMDGGYTWTALWGPISSNALQPWSQVGPLNLPVGTNAIRFRFESSGAGNVSPGGLWIDDVAFNNPGFPLVVVSDWGDPQPPQGFNMIPEAANAVTLSVTSPYNHPLYEGIRFRCIGYKGDGVIVPANNPPSGPYSSVDVVVNAEGWIEWLWAREFGVQTVSENGVGVPQTEGWYWFNENSTATITGIKYVEAPVAGWGWRCNGFIGEGSAPGGGVFLPSDDIELVFTINEATKITWTWKDQYKLTVVNPGGWGNPSPQSGESWFDTDANISATIDLQYYEGETTRHNLVSYDLQIGSNPPTSGVDRIVTFTISAPTTLNWNWQTEYLLDIRNPQFIGTVTPDVGVQWVLENTLMTCSSFSPTTDGVNTWLSIGYSINGTITYFNDYNNPSAIFPMTGPIEFVWLWELETLPFTVNSAFGLPSPAVGTHYYSFDATVTASVNSPYYPPTEPGVMHVCTGFSATGSITPAASSQLSVSFRLRSQNTTITWNWYTQYNLTVLSTIPDVVTVPEMRSGGFWYPEGTSIDASCEARIPGYRCSGYLLVQGEAQSSGDSAFISFDIVGPTTITWQWEEDDLLVQLPQWLAALQITEDDPRQGLFASMKRDPVNGRPSVAYYEVLGSQMGALRYAYWDGVRWHNEAVDSVAEAGYNVGLYASLQLDSIGRPHIAYFDAGNGDLKYAYRSVAGGWQVTIIDAGGPANNNVGSYCSLKLNALNEPRVSYYDTTAGDLKYAALEYGIWKVYIVDSTGNVGSHTCLALHPTTNQPRIAYRDGGARSLKFAWFANDVWMTMTVDNSDDTGYTPSMVVDGSGNAHIAYQMFNGTASALVYAIQSGTTFYPKTVAAEGGPNTGFVPTLALDAGDHPHIAYNDTKNHSLVYALYNGQQWLTAVLDTAAVGSYASLALYKNYPAIAYWSFSGLRYIEARTDSTTGGGSIPLPVGEAVDAGGGGCFIATSAFGSMADNAVAALTSVRDSALSSSAIGSGLVALYYGSSPVVAKDLDRSLAAVVRRLLAASN